MALNVIGLVSGGKDSFFSLLHCIAHGHRVVALANLYPEPAEGEDKEEEDDDDDEQDLNSFMYQTVGHQVIPLYAAATGLPLYRQPIVGHAVQSGRDYGGPVSETAAPDETESMTALLRRVMAAHPEANAVCAGALLSTYQRTRVESVAVRLGLVPLAFLWQFPLLPSVGGADYLGDLAAAAFDARIIKVASGGLDESLLWTNVASAAGRARLHRALQRLGLADDDAGGGSSSSMLGEGGEYETLVVDGPRALFSKGSIAVAEADRRVVHEGGGTAWLSIKNATVVRKDGDKGTDVVVRQPGLLDARFADVLSFVGQAVVSSFSSFSGFSSFSHFQIPPTTTTQSITTWHVVPQPSSSIADATQSIVDQVRHRLTSEGLLSPGPSSSPTHSIARTLVVLRRMADFAAFNAVYATLFCGAPNPPARVTIACGDRMPAGVDVAVYLGVCRPGPSFVRQGLHVQSRSYWAPANIGPYSQSVSVLAAPSSAATGPCAVSIAGQIPLVPATMALPDQAVEEAVSSSPPLTRTKPNEAEASFPFQTTLALQHLWRIGIDVGVQWWTSAVAYVPRARGTDAASLSLPQKAVIAAQAWHRAHHWRPRDEEDEEGDGEDGDGPDLWDRTFDSRYAMYGGRRADTAPQLPDWTVLGGENGEKDRQDCVGPVFLAEVDELPRSAAVEWHAQTGYSHVRSDRGYVRCRAWIDTTTKAQTYQTVLRVEAADDDDDDDDIEKMDMSQTVVQTAEAWAHADAAGFEQALRETGGGADVVFADVDVCRLPENLVAGLPIVPCFSLWSGCGERLAAVVVRTAVYKSQAQGLTT